jgi:hypothetical protein
MGLEEPPQMGSHHDASSTLLSLQTEAFEVQIGEFVLRRPFRQKPINSWCNLRKS